MMKALSIMMQLVGSLGFLLYGMKMMSNGVQKSAGQSLHRVLNLMTGNRVLGVLTGTLITMIIQSSGATTVMVVSFVNAGLMTLTQSVGVIFGANIGTTITAWIVTIFGFSFKISTVAIPIFGIGYAFTFIKRIKKINIATIGEALMGFGLLFLGLDLLSKVMSVDAEQIAFLTRFNNGSFGGYTVALFAGIIVTMILHSSSALTAIVLTMAYQGILTWEFSAVIVLGGNIGSTLDAVLASFGTKVDARRSALVHVLFNVAGTFTALIFLHPLLNFIDFIPPGTVEENITYHISMLHTVTKVLETLIMLPFVNQIAHLCEKLIKPKEDDTPNSYRLDFVETVGRGNAEAYIIRAEKEISDMAELTIKMFNLIEDSINDNNISAIADSIQKLAAQEDYADQMQEQLSRYLINCSKLPINEKLQNNISMMLRIVDDIESMTDDCYSVALCIQRSIDKGLDFEPNELDRIGPYMELVHYCLEFIRENINKPLSAEKLAEAEVVEEQIDMYRKKLKKIARKNLEQGANVRTELLYLDLIRHIEKIGDHAFSISESLSETK